VSERAPNSSGNVRLKINTMTGRAPYVAKEPYMP